ncbi:hypothetical protein ACFYZ2_41665 [Streptomyces sviceus]|uniref:hypothetical protein n=1 Tax=Streptomyces sviceus TaxID=285530 RepID=UPI0036A12B68
MTHATEIFDATERAMWSGRTEAYAGSFARLCVRRRGIGTIGLALPYTALPYTALP